MATVLTPAEIKQKIIDWITTNGQGDITGAHLYTILAAIMDYVGVGYALRGTAPASAPSPDVPSAYLAAPGTYTNYESGDTVIPEGSIAVLKYDGSAWSKSVIKVCEPVSVSQNIETGHIDITIGPTTTPVASVDEVGQLGQQKVDILPGKNLFNPKDITEGYYLNSSGEPQTQESRFYSGYIEVSPGLQYHISSNGDNSIDGNSNVCCCFYKEDKTFISSFSATNLTTTSPANAKYLCISGLISYIDSIQVEKGSARTEYAKFCPIDGYLNESFVISERLSYKLSTLPGINLFDKRKAATGKFLNSSGEETDNANYEITDYICIEPSTNYYLSKDGDSALSGNSNTSICFYDENKELLSTGGIIPATTKAVTTPATAKYLRASIALPEDYAQIEKGTARTEYTPYSDIGGYIEDLISSLQDIQKYKPVIKLYPAIKTLAAICFVWDDASVEDEDVVSVFKEYGAKCGFALIGDSSFENYAHNLNYLKYQKQGFSCLNHNSSGEGLPSYANEAAARAAVVLAKNGLEQFGLTINGFVCPNNAYVDDYRTMLGTFHAYAFGGSSISYNNRQSDVLKLVRTVIEPDSTSLQTIKDTIDAACADGGFISFYGHAARIGTSGYHDMSFYRDVLAYINTKRDAGLCYFDNPDNCVKYYFELKP